MRSVRSLAALATLLVASSVFAQTENFPDVPRNHWAFAALARMKADGLLVGYPDGLYRGGRPMSRYEMAVAMHAAYANLKNVTDAIDAVLRTAGSGIGPARPVDVKELAAATTVLRAELAAMKRYGSEIADLQRASDTFELELNQLGVDAQAMKDELRGLAVRVGALEKKKDPLEIGGEIDLWGGGGHGGKDDFGLTRDGRITGVADTVGLVDFGSRRAGITDDLTFLNEAAFDFKTTNETGVKVRGTLVATNAFVQSPRGDSGIVKFGFGNQSDVISPTGGYGLFGYGEGSGDVYLQDLVVSGSARGVDLEGGRLRIMATPWILQRIDNTLYYDNPRWDDGKYTYDGVKAAAKLGPVKALVYGGKDEAQSVNGVLLNPLRSGPANGLIGGGQAIDDRLLANRFLGTTLSTNVGSLELRGDWLALQGDDRTVDLQGGFDKLQVYGGEADVRYKKFRLSGGLRQTTAREQGLDDAEAPHDSHLTGNAWDAKLDWANGRIDLSAQYREVQTNYLAPGDWGRLGVLRNPTNIRGGIATAKVGLLRTLDLSLEGEISHGLSDSGASGTAFDRGTDIGRYSARLDQRFGRAWDGYVYYEQTHFSDLFPGSAAFGDSRYQWYGVGVTHALGTNVRFSLQYEQSAVRNDYQTSNGNDYRGGFLTSQVTVKF